MEGGVARTIYLIVGRSVGRPTDRLVDFRGKSDPEEVDSPIIRSEEWSIGGGGRDSSSTWKSEGSSFRETARTSPLPTVPAF